MTTGLGTNKGLISSNSSGLSSAASSTVCVEGVTTAVGCLVKGCSVATLFKKANTSPNSLVSLLLEPDSSSFSIVPPLPCACRSKSCSISDKR